jgi:hypothetical protein
MKNLARSGVVRRRTLAQSWVLGNAQSQAKS